jgi:hypothetical protein
MAAEIRERGPVDSYSTNGRWADTELRELRASASILIKRAERLETQIEQAEAVDGGQHVVAGGIRRADVPAASMGVLRGSTTVVTGESASNNESAKSLQCVPMPVDATSVERSSQRASPGTQDLIELTHNMVVN